MSLIAWYPLNGDLEDYSGKGVLVTPHSAVASNQGLLGKSYEFSGLNTSITTNDSLLVEGDLTYMAWINPVESGGTGIQGIISNHNHGDPSNFSLMYANGLIRMHGGYTDGSRSYGLESVTNVPRGVWSHIAITYNALRNNLTLYINGSLDRSVNLARTPKFSSYRFVFGQWALSYFNNYEFQGKLNDIRIYDHTLSLKEIKEISKAKILHYKFDRYETTTVNIARTMTNVYTNYHSLVKTNNDFVFTMKKDNSYVVIANGSYSGASLQGKKVSYSGFMFKNGSPHKFSGDRVNTYHSATPAETWDFNPVTGYFEIIQEWTSTSRWIFHAHANASIGDVISMKDLQVEVQDYPTGYTNDERTTAIIRDCSGFGNDGVVVVATAPSWSEDSPVGRGSMEFIGGKFITLPNMLGSDEQITVCAWFKSNGLGGSGYHIIVGGEEVELDVTSGGQARFGLIINNVRQVDNYSSGLSDGNYHHICGVYNGSIKSVYVDGVLVGSTAAVGKIRNNFTRRVGVFGTQTNYHANGNISDVRIYATALAPEDILEIYQTRASVDSVGNLHVYESDEVSGDTLGISSKGIAKITSINEVGRPIRYIRDYLNGSTSNTGNHWVEIQAINIAGVNVALGKGEGLLTDGVTTTSPYLSRSSGLQSVTVDLGSVRNVEYLHVWHYYSDGRTYHNTKTEVSTDGTNWVTVFDSSIEGEYPETSKGKIHLLGSDKMGISSDGYLYVNEIIEV